MAVYLLAGHYLGKTKKYQQGPKKGESQSTGTSSRGVRPQVDERDSVIELRGLIAKYLKNKPIMDNDYDGIEATRAWIKSVAKPTDIIIELHFDANDGKSPGTKSLVHGRASNSTQQLGRDLATAVASVIGVPNKGLKLGGDYYTWTVIPSNLNFHMFEVCAMSRSEYPKYVAKKEQVAKAIADVINKYDTGAATGGGNIGSSSVQSGTPWMDIAKSYLGKTEKNAASWVASLHKESGYGGNAADAWCGSFAAHCLRKAGVDVPKSFWAPLAKNWEKFPNLTPVSDLKNIPYGAVVTVLSTTGSKRHVAFYVGPGEGGGVKLLGGNQSNAVTISNDKRQVMFAGTINGFSNDSSTAGAGSLGTSDGVLGQVDYDPAEANKKANEAAKAMFLLPEAALEAVQDLPALLLRRAEAIEAQTKGQETGWRFDVNTETEIEAAVNSITVGSAYMEGMDRVVSPNSEYGKLSSKDLMEKVYPWNRYINPFYYEMFGKEYHKDMSVKPLYFWPQKPLIEPEFFLDFNAADMYKALYENKYKTGLMGRYVEATDITDQLEDSSKSSENNDDHDNPEAMFMMLETRYLKNSRDQDFKYTDDWSVSEFLTLMAKNLGLSDTQAALMAKGILALVPGMSTLALVGNKVIGALPSVGEAISAVGEFFTGNTVTNYTGEFPPGLPSSFGKLSDSTKDSIGVGQPATIRALMDYISRSEGTHMGANPRAKGYRDYYSHARVLDLSQPHPGTKYGAKNSNAGGRFQFMGPGDKADTWRGINGGRNVPMSIANQDKGFIALLKRRGIYEKALAGDWYGMFKVTASHGGRQKSQLALEWASVPAYATGDQGAYGGQKHAGMTREKAVMALSHLQKFYEGAKADGSQQVKVDGPNVISRAVDTVMNPQGTGSYDPSKTYTENGNLTVRVKPKAGSLKYKKNVGSLTQDQYNNLAKTKNFKAGTGPSTVRSVNVLDAGLFDIIVRNPGEVKFRAIAVGINPPKMASYTGNNHNEYYAAEAKKAAEEFLEGTSWLSSDQNDFLLSIEGYDKELGVAKVNLRKKRDDGVLFYNTYMIALGMGFASNGTGGVTTQDKARAAKRGMWKDTSKIYESAIGIANSTAGTVETDSSAPVANIPSRSTMGEIFEDKAQRTPTKKYPTPVNYTDNTKTGQWSTTTSFANDSNPSVSLKDAQVQMGINVITPLPGKLRIVKTNTPGGVVATVQTDVKDLVLKYYNLHEKSLDLITEGQEKTVKAGDVVGTIKGPGRVPELPFEALFREVPFNPLCAKDLSTWPINTTFRLADYLNKDGFKSTTNPKVLISQYEWVQAHTDGGIVIVANGGEGLDTVEGGSTTSTDLTETQKRTYEELRGHNYQKVKDPSGEGPLRDSASVFSNIGIYSNILKYYLKPFEYGNSQMVPQVKGYVIIGNEDDDYYVEGVPLREPVVYELPAIQNFSLACNNDDNPVDVARFTLVNPSHLVTSPMYFDYNKGADIQSSHTQFYNMAFLEKARIKAGTRVSFKIGYTNNPNFNPTVFNGVIKEVGGTSDYIMECIAEGFGAELLNSEYGSEKPVNFTNGHNAATGAIFGISLLDEAISHFGARLGKWRFATDYVGSIFRDQHVDEFASGAEWQNDTIFEGKGRIGDMRDPENKALVAPWSWGDNIFNLWFPTRANTANRVYANIYSDVIESVHDDFSTKMTLWLNLLSWDKSSNWKYFAYKATPWSIMKEMEHRHPGTVAKPLIYGERMTMFYGIPFQNYIATDLKPHFMTSAALSNRFENVDNPYTETYLKARTARMEPSTGYHLLHSDLNIISNRLSLNRDFYTRVNVLEFNRTYDGHEPNSSSDVITMTIDDNLAAHEIRAKTIAMGGTHKEHTAYLYGTQELKREAEKMYSGSIVIVGNPHIKAGDYAYLQDRVRGLSGTIKIRECEHHVTETDGYITVITPGLWVEPSQFAWSTHLTVLTALGKFTSEAVSDVSVEMLMEELATYYSIALAASKHKTRHFSDMLVAGGSTAAFAYLGGRTAMKMARQSTWTKLGNSAAVKGSRSLALGVLNTFKAYGGKALSAIENSPKFKAAGGFITTHVSKWRWYQNLGGVGKWLTGGKLVSRAMSVGKNALLLARGVAVFGSNLLMGIPVLGWLARALIQVGIAFVAAKVNKERLTRQPISFVPLTYNYGPYVAGVDGFINNTYLDSLMLNLKQTWKTVVKAKQYYDLNHGDAVQSGPMVIGSHHPNDGR